MEKFAPLKQREGPAGTAPIKVLKNAEAAMNFSAEFFCQ